MEYIYYQYVVLSNMLCTNQHTERVVTQQLLCCCATLHMESISYYPLYVPS